MARRNADARSCAARGSEDVHDLVAGELDLLAVQNRGADVLHDGQGAVVPFVLVFAEGQEVGDVALQLADRALAFLHQGDEVGVALSHGHGRDGLA